MIIGGISRNRALILAAGVGLASARSHAQCEYQVTPIQPAPCPIIGIPITYPMGVSNAGHVVGWHWDCDLFNTDDVAFVWTAETGLVDIPFPPGTTSRRAEAVNSAGRIVGSANFPNDGLSVVGFAYDWPDRRLINLGALPGANWSEALAVNEAGQVVGYSYNNLTGDPPLTPFLWQEEVMTPLELPLGPNGVAMDIDDLGGVVGWMGDSTSTYSRAFSWHSGVATDLGIAPGAVASIALAVNNLGQVLVNANYQEYKHGPVLQRTNLWDDGQWTDLGWLPGFDRCLGTDVNDTGQVVGRCTTSVPPYPEGPFIWQGGVMLALNDLIPDPAATAAIPFAINQQGQIATLDGYPGGVTALLLTPIDQPRGDVDHDCIVGIHDIVLLLDAWGPCPVGAGCSGDVDGDGDVDVIDLLILLANWTF